MPLPRMTGEVKIRSTLLAPTVKIQGARFDAVAGVGPEFPALHTTTTFLFTAWSAPIAIPSSEYFGGVPVVPMEMLRTSTPSPRASSMADSISASKHVFKRAGSPPGIGQHTLYMANLTRGAPPLAVPYAKPPRAETPRTLRPPTVDDVCVPWPSWSRGDRYSAAVFRRP